MHRNEPPLISPLLPDHLQQRASMATQTPTVTSPNTPSNGQFSPPSNVSIIEKEGGTLIQFDLISRLLKDRIIFIGEPISDPLANYVIAQMLYLQMQDPAKDINIYINSPGGSVTAGLAIYDTMQFLTCDVNTFCIGMAASMGAVLLCAGSPGKRHVLPNAHVMIHQVSGGAQGTASDVERTVEFMYSLKHRLNAIIAKHTGKSVEQVEEDADRDNYMTGAEAMEYGIVDKVLENKKDLPKSTEDE